MAAEELPIFRHKPISAEQIRLLVLKSRVHGPHIMCEILHCDRENDREYVALSYSWGPQDGTEFITVDGCRLNVSSHLKGALKHLQQDDKDVVYWIDQVCIDQANDEEKSEQVYMMQSIYERASHVEVWLGRSNHKSDLIMMFFEALTELKDGLGRQDPITPWDEKYGLARLSEAFEEFCERDYWKRLWVIQEYALGKDVVIRCGRLQISQWVLDNAIDILNRAFTASANSFVSGILARRARYQTEEPREPLFVVMFSSLVLETDYNQVRASDARDRVFALMGLCGDIEQFVMFPDYSASTAIVYQILARRFLEQGHIDNLAYCQFPHALPDDGLPTWAPDWSMYIRGCLKGHKLSFHASAGRVQSKFPPSIDLKVMTLEGTFIDTISELGSEWDPNWLEDLDLDAALRYLKDIWRLRSLSPRLRDSSTLFDCTRLAIADQCRFKDEDFPEWLDIDWPSALTPLANDDQLEAEFYSLIHRERYTPLLKNLHSRRPFISESGWVGLAPWHGKPGDKVVIFLGGSSAYTIRAKDATTYTVVGETYVQGIMYGEFMAGEVQIESFNLV
ncbi:HET-domain-containing protein [Periconia macrospinosa]|uniref:HET-domain-containing protein n=1 Tax=Periconia macrospinosa TaxID=97972 RepID=A0A2V1DF38_9PLEO|nr:HET-domain-containing protein [Periconia macrospinosa]